MLATIGLLLACQLIGEVVTRSAGVPIPGPVAGLALLLALLLLRPGLTETVRPTIAVVLANLSLLFVPAGVGVVGNLQVLAADGPALLVVLVASTLLSMLAAVGTFVLASRLVARGGQ
jgi:putative effector of murein hydrolase LrgA (UPF0299 family)